MIIHVNQRPCEAQTGDLLLHVAQHNKSHIGYICGGNGICQSCFVYVQEGMEHLSPLSNVEKACISEKLLAEGGRLACQTVITGEGTIRLLTRAEKLRRIVLGLNVPGFITYAQTIGYNVLNKLPDCAGSAALRIRNGELNPGESLRKIGAGLGHASLFVSASFLETFAFMQLPLSLITGGASGMYTMASDAVCSVSGGAVHLPGSTCRRHEPEKTASVHTVTISGR
ncbi:2Fe-2S iron-sulfur cluster-binding protein [Pelodictyon luteolum]|uniref:Chlorosome envelope protein J n=1 Tax=Chlorobium luteolum (strain DSM 273 / BCRC 81028 / 2530) TaxID=319225 RepID=Q3B570_CHLL3|nr:2Fe-2S iron-sulfur cluster-binding protein [Pelodictyon luteolum]ABB23511.1 chlorosome envelope protein J [Pelodictyon luteolum DSM 273]